MKTITDHKVNGLNEAIEILVMDEPGAGGANHHYLIQPMTDSHPQGAINPVTIKFQNGPIKEVGVNGISQEALIAVCIDRLRSFQAGPYACRENALALTKLEEAQMWLMKRTRDRMARGVEGTNQK
ncbi:MAG: hypothetical protein PHV34_05885 [Verrucomicrobiae bacterium]|nr:hypothetical protein [Verrucomicrobiae bacterium]